MVRLSYTDRVTNTEVLHRTNLQRTLMKDIVRRQMAFFGHIIRKEEIENLVVTGYVEGKRAKGRQRETFLTYLHKMKGKKLTELIHLATLRELSGYRCPNSSLHLQDIAENDE